MDTITKRILSGEILLKDITLEEFRANRKIYNDYKSAQGKGFEASHIIPVSVQLKKYNKEHGTNLTRKEFNMNLDIFDDRCYRYTPFEHIVDHYLSAIENEEEISTFTAMVQFNFHKLPKDQQELLNSLKEFSKLREIGFNKMSETRKGKEPWNKGKTMKEATGNKDWVNPRKGKTIQEITKNPNYVNPLKGVPRKNYLGEDYKPWNKGVFGIKRPETWVNPVKGKSWKDYHENYVSPLLGRKNPKCSSMFKERRNNYLKELENGTFVGSWNEYQHKCKLERLNSNNN